MSSARAHFHVFSLIVGLFGAACGLVSAQSAPVPPLFNPSGTIVVDGNSLVVYRGDLSQWPSCLTAVPETCVHALGDWLWPALGLPNRLGVVSVGLRGAGTAELLPRAASVVDPLFDARPVMWVILWEGSNDLYYGRGVSVALANLRAYVTARHVVGWRVAVLTVIPRVDVPASWEWDRLALNAQIRAGATGADLVLDLARHSPFLDASVTKSPLYLPDGVHLSETGVRHVALWIGSHPDLLKGLQ